MIPPPFHCHTQKRDTQRHPAFTIMLIRIRFTVGIHLRPICTDSPSCPCRIWMNSCCGFWWNLCHNSCHSSWKNSCCSSWWNSCYNRCIRPYNPCNCRHCKGSLPDFCSRFSFCIPPVITSNHCITRVVCFHSRIICMLP